MVDHLRSCRVSWESRAQPRHCVVLAANSPTAAVMTPARIIRADAWHSPPINRYLVQHRGQFLAVGDQRPAHFERRGGRDGTPDRRAPPLRLSPSSSGLLWRQMQMKNRRISTALRSLPHLHHNAAAGRNRRRSASATLAIGVVVHHARCRRSRWISKSPGPVAELVDAEPEPIATSDFSSRIDLRV